MLQYYLHFPEKIRKLKHDKVKLLAQGPTGNMRLRFKPWFAVHRACIISLSIAGVQSRWIQGDLKGRWIGEENLFI